MNTIEISSQRTVLRLINLTDVEAIHELHSLPETDRFNTLGIPENLADTQEIVAQWVTANQAENTTNYTFKIERGREILPLKSGWSDNFEYSILESDERKQSTVQKQ